MRISLKIKEWVIPRPLWGDVPLSCERLACSKLCFGGTRDVYVVSRFRESLSGSLSVSYIRHVLGIGRLGIFGGDLGEEGRCLCFLDGGGV